VEVPSIPSILQHHAELFSSVDLLLISNDITYDGNAQITEKGVLWIDPNFIEDIVTQGKKIIDTSYETEGKIRVEMPNFINNLQRAIITYATNNIGTTYDTPVIYQRDGNNLIIL
jgi:hypothetical protein